jgi:hypothetical protein
VLVSLKSDLEVEKRAFSKIWAKRQTRIEGVIISMAHIVGDLEAIGDLSLAEIKNLDLTLAVDGKVETLLLQKGKAQIGKHKTP